MWGNQRLEAELAEIRERAIRESRRVEEDTRPGYGWQPAYPGQVLGRSLTCETCGAVVTIQTQDKHTTWHES